MSICSPVSRLGTAVVTAACSAACPRRWDSAKVVQPKIGREISAGQWTRVKSQPAYGESGLFSVSM